MEVGSLVGGVLPVARLVGSASCAECPASNSSARVLGSIPPSYTPLETQTFKPEAQLRGAICVVSKAPCSLLKDF